MVKIRMFLDHLLDNNNYHFSINNDGYLVINNECGNTLITFNDIRLNKKPSNKELEYVKKLLIKKIDEINKYLKKRDELIKNQPKEVYTYGFGSNLHLSIKVNDLNQQIYIDNDGNINYFNISFKDEEEIKDIKEKLLEELENYKKYQQWLKEIRELDNKYRQCFL